jgi:hypothetical protein
MRIHRIPHTVGGGGGVEGLRGSSWGGGAKTKVAKKIYPKFRYIKDQYFPRFRKILTKFRLLKLREFRCLKSNFITS